MAKYSRTQKYEDLRTKLQNDSEKDIRTTDLSKFEKRLNQINANNFEAPDETVKPADADPIHARRQAQYDAAPVRPEDKPAIDKSFLRGNENYTNAFNNEYLDEYIKEVKQYNIDQGNAFSTNTDLNILKSLKGERPAVQAPSKPFEEEKTKDVPQVSKPVKPAVKEDSGNIPFFSSGSDFADDTGDVPLSDTRTMTKEDIAAEVQRLIQGSVKPEPVKQQVQQQPQPVRQKPVSAYDDERSARQQLLNETTQMRAQLDDYEDNLTEVSDKMNHTNKVLNIVLVILIIVLSFVLAIVVYWLLLQRGIIK